MLLDSPKEFIKQETYISTSMWVLLTPNADQNLHFSFLTGGDGMAWWLPNRNKTLNQHFGANLKKRFFAKFCSKFVTFFLHPKHWPKYATCICFQWLSLCHLVFLFLLFLNVGPLKESIFLTTFYGLYFSHHLHIYYKLQFFMI